MRRSFNGRRDEMNILFVNNGESEARRNGLPSMNIYKGPELDAFAQEMGNFLERDMGIDNVTLHVEGEHRMESPREMVLDFSGTKTAKGKPFSFNMSLEFDAAGIFYEGSMRFYQKLSSCAKSMYGSKLTSPRFIREVKDNVKWMFDATWEYE